MTFGERLKGLRKQYGFSQADMERKTGKKREYLSKFENEHLPNPTIKTVKNIAKAFDMTISEFLEGVLED